MMATLASFAQGRPSASAARGLLGWLAEQVAATHAGRGSAPISVAACVTVA